MSEYAMTTIAFLEQYKSFVYTSFGTFDSYDSYPNDSIVENALQYAMFSLSVFCMCIVMMNLLIGILSKAMEKILEKKTQTDYAAICEIIYDLEVFRSWF
jgi:hypothetical protein